MVAILNRLNYEREVQMTAQDFFDQLRCGRATYFRA
jgi:hypothetical protein